MSTDDEPQVTITMSPTVGKIAEALAKAQAAMGPASKDSVNPHFKSKYASLAACFDAVKPLHAQGIAVLQPPVPHGADGVCVATLLIHSSGEWIRGELYMPAAKRDPQGFGSALSYARRYCLTSTVGLATDDDDGADASRTPSAPGPAKAPQNDGLFRNFCERVDHAETSAALNDIALGAKRACGDKAITEANLNTIAKAVASKRALLGNQSHANGAT